MSQEKSQIALNFCDHNDAPCSFCLMRAEGVSETVKTLGYRLIPELTLLTPEKIEGLLFQYIMPQDSFQKSIYTDLMKIAIQAQLSLTKKELDNK